MTSTPDTPSPDTPSPDTPPPGSREDPSDPMAQSDDTSQDAPGAEIGMTEGGTTFEPEEDPDAE